MILLECNVVQVHPPTTSDIQRIFCIHNSTYASFWHHFQCNEFSHRIQLSTVWNEKYVGAFLRRICTSVAFWLADQSKPIPNPEYLLFRSSGDLKGFIPFPRRSKANSSSFPKTHFSQSGHFSSSAGYSNFPVLHNRKELKFFAHFLAHAICRWP